MTDRATSGIGNRVAPRRFIAFGILFLIASGIAMPLAGWRQGVMIGFDIAALVFLGSCVPLLRDSGADHMRRLAVANDANRTSLLAISIAVSVVILVAVAAELAQSGAPDAATVLLIIVTLALAWCFSNMVFTFHYAHLYYSPGDDGKDHRGITVPNADEPDYWDFVYFAFTLGMTFQTSDIEIDDRGMRRVALFHCLAAFVFNLGIIAFSVNVLSSK